MKFFSFTIPKKKPEPVQEAFIRNIATAYVAIERLSNLINAGKGEVAQAVFQDLYMDLEDWMIVAKIPPHLQWVFQVVHEYFVHSGDWERAKTCILSMTARDPKQRKEFEEVADRLRGKTPPVETTNAKVPAG